MKRIPLTRGLFALVDNTNYEWLSRWEWCAHPNGAENFYAMRSVYFPIKKSIWMHKEVFGGDQLVDHKNRDTLDNRRDNLRAATHSQNRANSKRRSNNTSGYQGVSRHKLKWKAEIVMNQKFIYLGLFENLKDAALAYDDAALKHFGEFANTNFSKIKTNKTNNKQKKR
jgi:hypothetical protein